MSEEDRLTNEQLRTVLEYLFGNCIGDPVKTGKVHSHLIGLRQYKKEHWFYMWLAKNKISGTKLIDFFDQFESHLEAVIFILNRLDGRKHTKEWYQANELKGVN